jgi:hypothetical protein
MVNADGLVGLADVGFTGPAADHLFGNGMGVQDAFKRPQQTPLLQEPGRHVTKQRKRADCQCEHCERVV